VKAALVGYTNARKSSLLRALTGPDARVEDRLFANLDTQSREIGLPQTPIPNVQTPSLRLRFTDTVGFIRKLPHHLVSSFRATLEEAADADVIVHVVDASHPAWEDQAEVVGEALAGVLADGGPAPSVVMALNKADLLVPPEVARRLAEAGARGWDTTATSATAREGLAELRERACAPSPPPTLPSPGSR
jgi:GTP-binding protein HflX